MSEKVTGHCVVCQVEIPDYDPKMCCSGYDCGCMGRPTEPEVCSSECFDKAYGPQQREKNLVVGGNPLMEFAEKVQAMKDENKSKAKENFKPTMKEQKYLASLSKKDRKRFINKSLGRDQELGVSGPTKKTPFGKKYF